jgi:NADH-quinone oxidoreductase subunit L
VGVVLCALCAIGRVKSKLPAFLSVACLAVSFALAVLMYLGLPEGGAQVTTSFPWFDLSWDAGGTHHAFIANFAFYIDSLTCLWMLFVTGLATLIALYASEYMSHDVGAGYCRFFAAFNLFVFSMACLVMADNFVLLYLGWEGVGLCSYLLIGYFYKRPSAVAAAKKAFIVNRIGDLGLALGIWLIYVKFGTVQYAELFANPDFQEMKALAFRGEWSVIPFGVQAIPLLLMVGAFGKSAQFPLYVWLPDAMEGPTPVSALIHAATMVTAGVFLVARNLPIFAVSEHALAIVAWVGAITALLSATIGMAQFDIKRIMAYSTVSQLGYMFAGLGVLTAANGNAEMAAAGPYHVFTHAFFKAMLFLSCGAVMHGFAGQLDLRKLSGVWWMKGWGVVGFAMLVGCLNLAGFPITAGFFSKDMILANAFSSHELQPIGWILLLTAGLTAYYTFRVFFRVFVGPQHFEPGDEVHGSEAPDEHGHGAEHTHGHDHGHEDHGHFHPHAPGWAINTVLGILAVSALVIGFGAIPFFNHWVGGMVEHATTAQAFAEGEGHAEHATFFGYNPHQAMMVVSSLVGILGIAVAWWLHKAGRTTAATSRADALLPLMGRLATAAQHKWYVDEIYDFLIRTPLWVLSNIFHLIDKFLVDGAVDLFGLLPRAIGSALRPAQSGRLHGYAVAMAGGVAFLLLIVLLASRGF